MATVVISTDDHSYFSNMRRTRSQPKYIARHSSFSAPTPPRRKLEDYVGNPKIYPDSAPSSVASSPHLGDSDNLSYVSTPPTDLSLDLDETMKSPIFPEDHFVIPHFAQNNFYDPEDLEPPTSPKTGDSYTVSPVELDNEETNTSRPGTPEYTFNVDAPVQDDTAVESQPTRHVDYLSHEWREEDIWSSWRYIVSRRSEVANSARLENASWRTWTKAKHNLQTVSPEALNWLKDCDVTWLYGPLQPGPNVLGTTGNGSSRIRHPKNSSFIDKKPILKKRSMSEVMLQRSLSASALVKTAAAAVQAQRKVVRPGLNRATTDDYTSFGFSMQGMSQTSSSVTESGCSSGAMSPSMERRHIHFNEQVEQCIAVDVKGEDEEEDDEEADTADIFDDSDSSDDAVMMKRTRTKKRMPLRRRKARKAPVIAKLPSTTLKYRDELPETVETAQKHSIIGASIMSPSSSQETLCPAPPTSHFLFGDDDDDDEAAEEAMLSPRKKFLSSEDDDDVFGFHHVPSNSSLGAEPAGMHRTDSGMFMPCEEGASSTNEGVFGRVVDTVNTARDIAHVIWNVGWRK